MKFPYPPYSWLLATPRTVESLASLTLVLGSVSGQKVPSDILFVTLHRFLPLLTAPELATLFFGPKPLELGVEMAHTE